MTPIPWIPNGYFYPEDVRPSFCPFVSGRALLSAGAKRHDTGFLPPGHSRRECPGPLCCAGRQGDSTGGAFERRGLLVANDISSSRTRALLRNVELFGFTNAFVTNETPARLKDRFPEFFHKILLDAPCSGEGMFRKEEALARDWTPEKSDELAVLQRELILQAADMLRPGGQLLYSTCTFAPDEDEGVVSYLLENRPDMELMELPAYEGFTPGVPAWGNGDPRFPAVFISSRTKCRAKDILWLIPQRRPHGSDRYQFSYAKPNADTRKWLELFLKEIGLKTLGGKPFDWNRVETRKDKVYYLPPVTGDFRGLTFLRNGLVPRAISRKTVSSRLNLLHWLFDKDDAEAVISLPVSDQRLTRYLKGETLNIEPEEAAHTKGWHLLCVEGYPSDSASWSADLKNKYPAGWRV